MSAHFGPDAPLRRDGVKPLIGNFAHERDEVLEACLYAAAEEAVTAAANVLTKVVDADTSHVAAQIDDLDVSFTLRFESNCDARPGVSFGAVWTRSEWVPDKPFQFTILVRPNAEFPELVDVEMRIETADRCYEVCPHGGLIRETSAHDEALADELQRPWLPLSPQGLALVVGGATEILARTAVLERLVHRS